MNIFIFLPHNNEKENFMWKKIFVGLLVGFISGMFASGGGLLLIPAYVYLFNSNEKEARATAIFCILPMVMTTAIFYGRGNFINWRTGILCAIGGIIGSFIGTKLLTVLKGKYLKLIFIIFLIYSGIRIIFF